MEALGHRPERLPFAALTTAVSIGTTAFFTLYSLIPISRADTPGVGTVFVGVLMAFVIAMQATVPALVRRFSLRIVVLGSLVSLAAGTLVTGASGSIAGGNAGTTILLVGAAFAGAGFGVLIVAGAQGVGMLVPGPRLGRALGLYGLVTALSTALGSPAGVQLGLTTSTLTLCMFAGALCLVGAACALGIAHRAPDHGNSALTVEAVDSPTERATGVAIASGSTRTLALTLVFLLVAILFIAHGVTSLPVHTSGAVAPAITILLLQLGVSAGRWLGGVTESRITRPGTVLLAVALVVVGATVGVLSGIAPLIGGAAVVLGVGVGTAQTVTLHMAMQRVGPARASVSWNLSVDCGLWVGGILAGIALAEGALVPGTLACAGVLIVLGVSLSVQDRIRSGRQ